jgi:hypothetical protein
VIGRTEIEDALKRLDKLTHEEAWIGIAENLKATHTVGESVREVVDKVVVIDNRVAGVGDRVDGVDDRVRVVDGRVTEIVRGAYTTFDRAPKSYLNSLALRRKGSESRHPTNGQYGVGHRP